MKEITNTRVYRLSVEEFAKYMEFKEKEKMVDVVIETNPYDSQRQDLKITTIEGEEKKSSTAWDTQGGYKK